MIEEYPTLRSFEPTTSCHEAFSFPLGYNHCLRRERALSVIKQNQGRVQPESGHSKKMEVSVIAISKMC